MKRIRFLLLCAIALLACPGFAQGGPEGAIALAGSWEGTLKVGAASLRIVFNVRVADGLPSATMDSPDQGAKGIPVSAVSLTGSIARFEVKAIGGTYEGALSADAAAIVGQWMQSGMEFPLELRRKGRTTVQDTPAQSYPYASVDVEFTNPEAGIALSGTLILPEGKGPFPAVLLVSGSGPQNRDEEIFGHKPFLVIADYLARRGIASLRYDDRGVGVSKGSFAAATTMDFASDARAGFAFLAARIEVDARRVGIVGHSEGAIVAAIAASTDPGVTFIAMLAGPGVRGGELLLMQNEALAAAAGVDQETIAEAGALNAQLYAIAAKNAPEADLRAEIAAAFKKAAEKGWAGIPLEGVEASAKSAADQLLTPWLRTFVALDPAAYLSRLAIPVLAMNGSKDLQVPSKDNLGAVGRALDAAGNHRYKLLELEGLNHLFQHATTGSPGEYASISETFAPEALTVLGDWITETSR